MVIVEQVRYEIRHFDFWQFPIKLGKDSAVMFKMLCSGFSQLAAGDHLSEIVNNDVVYESCQYERKSPAEMGLIGWKPYIKVLAGNL